MLPRGESRPSFDDGSQFARLNPVVTPTFQLKAEVGAAVCGQSALPPGRGNDRCFDEIAEHAVVLRRFVMFVEEADWNEEQSSAATDAVGELALGVELLELHFALVVGGRDSVLEFQLGRHPGAIVEAVTPAEDGAREIRLRLARIMNGPRIGDLAITEERRLARRGRLRFHGLLEPVDAGREVGLR
jgi:hypothetical protein